MPKTSSDPLLATGDDFRRLIKELKQASRLIFSGFLVLALAVIAYGFMTADAGGAMADRRLHYGLMVAILAAYVYLQRR